MQAGHPPPTQPHPYKPGLFPQIFSDFLDNKNLLSSDLHVSGGARSWPTEAKTSGFPFLTEMPNLFTSDSILQNLT